jgi:hypothetical protein
MPAKHHRQSVSTLPAGEQRDEAGHRDGGEETPGPNIIKLFAAVIYGFRNKLYSVCTWQAFQA